MQFDGLEPLREGFPLIAVVTLGQQFDLHNDADLREIAFDFRAGECRIAWTMKEPAWGAPGRPETWQRKTVAGIVLIFSGVRSVAVAGKLVDAVRPADTDLDFLEYSRLAPGVGQVRIVLQNAAEIAVAASRCQLRTTDMS